MESGGGSAVTDRVVGAAAQVSPTVVLARRLRRDAGLDVRPDGTLRLATGSGIAELPPLGAALTGALQRLADGPAADVELAMVAGAAESLSATLRLQNFLRQLEGAGWLEHTVTVDGSPIAALRPLGHQASRPAQPPEGPSGLSRFAAIRAADAGLTVETPRSASVVDIVDPRLARMLFALAAGDEPRCAHLPDAAVRAVLQLLCGAALLSGRHPGADAENDRLNLAQWSPVDLALHARARSGRTADGYGGTFRLRGRFDPLPAAPEPRGDCVVTPAPVDLAAVTAADPPFSTVLESRRSIRAHDDTRPVTVDQLGELLYRTLRCRRVYEAGGQQVLDRPIPSGGALHELEVYPIVSNCQGLAPGVWHYDTVRHLFERVAEPTPAMLEMVAQARATSMLPADPQVLLVVAARFGRVMWKYESMAYALTLKHVGVLYQSLYLVATAMGLAPCAQGGGNADLFAAAAGIDYYAEGSVGEFVVGSRPADSDNVGDIAW